MAVVTNRSRHHSLTVELPPPPLLHRPAPPPPAPFSDFEKLSVLGHGNGGTVYKVLHRASSSLFALKLPHPHPQQQRHLSREISALRRAPSSPFVIRCHSVLPSTPALLLDYMDAGSLDSLLLCHRRLPEPALREITRQLLLGLSYLHSRNVVHRDLKPSNLLLNLRGEIKICDFGVSRIMARSLDPCDSYVGTCAYMSPERFDPGSYGAQYDGYAADVWSLGLTVMELFLGRFPLLEEGQRPDWATLMCAICFDDPPSLAVGSGASEELRGFVECCLDREPGKRSTVEELLVHPFVGGGEVDSQARQAFLQLLPVASEHGGDLGSSEHGRLD